MGGCLLSESVDDFQRRDEDVVSTMLLYYSKSSQEILCCRTLLGFFSHSDLNFLQLKSELKIRTFYLEFLRLISLFSILNGSFKFYSSRLFDISNFRWIYTATFT